MNQSSFRKTVLALSIATVSVSAQAQELTLGNAGLEIKNESYADTVTIKGSYNAKNTADSQAIYIEDSTFAKDLILNATIDSGGADSAGIDFMTSGYGLPLEEQGVNLIGGDLINNGSIKIEQGTALLLDTNTTIKGSFINNGTLHSYGEPYAEDEGDSEESTAVDYGWMAKIEGDFINNINGKILAEGTEATAVDISNATLGGKFINEGLIQVSGNDSEAVDLVDSTINGFENNGSILAEGKGSVAVTMTESTVRGDFINRGNIDATGAPYFEDDDTDFVTAVELWDTTIDGDFINDADGEIVAIGEEATAFKMEGGEITGQLINRGLISVEGDNSVAVDPTGDSEYDFAKIKAIINEGTISALGEDARAILLDGIEWTQSGTHVRNTGTITAEGVAIEADAIIFPEHSNVLKIHNSGNIIAGTRAINIEDHDDDDQVELVWDAGNITGNLVGLSHIDIQGSVTFQGTTNDTANIVMVRDSWIDVGSTQNQKVGHLEFTAPHTTIEGNLYVAGNSSIGTSIVKATDPSKAIIDVSGTAEFAKESAIKLTTQASDFSAKGAEYIIVRAGQLENNGLTVTSTSAILDVSEYKDANNQLLAKVTIKSQSEIEGIIDNGSNPDAGNGDTGSTPGEGNTGSNPGAGNDNVNPGTPAANRPSSAAQAGARFASVASTLSDRSPNDPVFQAYMAASQDPAELARLAERFVPEVNGGATQAATGGQALITGATSNRTGSIRGASSGDTFSNTGLWIQALHSNADQSLRDGVTGYDAKSKGFAIGADGKLNEKLTLGMAYSFINTDVKSDNGNSTEVDGHNFTLYGGLEEGNYFVDANLTYGINDNDSKRHIAGTTAKASYDSTVLAASLLAGYTHAINSQFLVEPRIAARYANIDIDGYKEKGSSAALAIGSQRYEVAELGAGLRLAGDYALSQGSVQPQLTLMAYHDLVADQARSTSSFVLGGTPFVSHGAKPARNSYEVGVGVDYAAGAFTAGVSYDMAKKSDFDADTWTVKLRYDF